MFFHFVVFLLLGLIVGVFARWRLPRGEANRWFGPVGLAIAGSMAGGSIAAGIDRDGGPIVFMVAALAAVTVIVVQEALGRRRLHV